MSSQRVNLWPSPNFKKTDFWENVNPDFYAPHSIDDDGWLTIYHRDDRNYVGVTIENLEPSMVYVLSIEIYTSASSTRETLRVNTDAYRELGRIETQNGRGHCRFAAPSDGTIWIYLDGPDAGVVRKFRNPQLELASTYDTAVAGGARRIPSYSLGTLAQSSRRSAWVVAA